MPTSLWMVGMAMPRRALGDLLHERGLRKRGARPACSTSTCTRLNLSESAHVRRLTDTQSRIAWTW